MGIDLGIFISALRPVIHFNHCLNIYRDFFIPWNFQITQITVNNFTYDDDDDDDDDDELFL